MLYELTIIDAKNTSNPCASCGKCCKGSPGQYHPNQVSTEIQWLKDYAVKHFNASKTTTNYFNDMQLVNYVDFSTGVQFEFNKLFPNKRINIYRKSNLFYPICVRSKPSEDDDLIWYIDNNLIEPNKLNVIVSLYQKLKNHQVFDLDLYEYIDFMKQTRKDCLKGKIEYNHKLESKLYKLNDKWFNYVIVPIGKDNQLDRFDGSIFNTNVLNCIHLTENGCSLDYETERPIGCKMLIPSNESSAHCQPNEIDDFILQLEWLAAWLI